MKQISKADSLENSASSLNPAVTTEIHNVPLINSDATVSLSQEPTIFLIVNKEEPTPTQAKLIESLKMRIRFRCILSCFFPKRLQSCNR